MGEKNTPIWICYQIGLLLPYCIVLKLVEFLIDDQSITPVIGSVFTLAYSAPEELPWLSG